MKKIDKVFAEIREKVLDASVPRKRWLEDVRSLVDTEMLTLNEYKVFNEYLNEFQVALNEVWLDSNQIKQVLARFRNEIETVCKSIISKATNLKFNEPTSQQVNKQPEMGGNYPPPLPGQERKRPPPLPKKEEPYKWQSSLFRNRGLPKKEPESSLKSNPLAAMMNLSQEKPIAAEPEQETLPLKIEPRGINLPPPPQFSAPEVKAPTLQKGQTENEQDEHIKIGFNLEKQIEDMKTQEDATDSSIELHILGLMERKSRLLTKIRDIDKKEYEDIQNYPIRKRHYIDLYNTWQKKLEPKEAETPSFAPVGVSTPENKPEEAPKKVPEPEKKRRGRKPGQTNKLKPVNLTNFSEAEKDRAREIGEREITDLGGFNQQAFRHHVEEDPVLKSIIFKALQEGGKEVPEKWWQANSRSKIIKYMRRLKNQLWPDIQESIDIYRSWLQSENRPQIHKIGHLSLNEQVQYFKTKLRENVL